MDTVELSSLPLYLDAKLPDGHLAHSSPVTLHLYNMAKRALVISGGGSKGAFAVGALEYLVKDLGMSFDLIAGTSTGALIAPLAVLGEIDSLVRLYTSVETHDVIRKRNPVLAVLFHSSFYSSEPLEELIERELPDAKARRVLEADVQMLVTTVSMQTGKVTYWATGPATTERADVEVERIASPEVLRRAVLASASEPVFLPLVRVLEGGEQHADGAVRELEPLKIAILNGATEICAIVMEPQRRMPVQRFFRRILPTAARTVELFTEEVLLNDLREAHIYNEATLYRRALKQRIRARFDLTDAEAEALFAIPGVPDPTEGKRVVTLRVIRPESELPLSGLEFDPETMREMVALGRARAADVFAPLA